jgi:hypothetical protein
MRFRELLESIGPTVGMCFGRWNPPHKGHRSAWAKAAEYDHWFVGTNPNTQGPNDPLPYDVKLKCMETIYPEISGHVISDNNAFDLAMQIYNKYGEQAHLKVCTDETWLGQGIIKYNGVESKHGFYKFASIEHIHTPRISSATDLRNAVRRGDRDAFSAAAGVSADTPVDLGDNTYDFFDVVAHYLKDFPEKPKK